MCKILTAFKKINKKINNKTKTQVHPSKWCRVELKDTLAHGVNKKGRWFARCGSAPRCRSCMKWSTWTSASILPQTLYSLGFIYHKRSPPRPESSCCYNESEMTNSTVEACPSPLTWGMADIVEQGRHVWNNFYRLAERQGDYLHNWVKFLDYYHRSYVTFQATHTHSNSP